MTSAASVLRAHAGLPASASSLLPSNGLSAGAWIVIVQYGWAAGSVYLPLSRVTPRTGDEEVQAMCATNAVESADGGAMPEAPGAAPLRRGGRARPHRHGHGRGRHHPGPAQRFSHH